jgi:tumor protein p53-inducible protein 3
LGQCEEGVNVILDPIGKNYFHQNLNVMGMDSKLIYIALMSGSIVEKFDLSKLFRKRGSVQWSTLRNR